MKTIATEMTSATAFEQEAMIPKSLAESSQSSCWRPKLHTLVAAMLGFVLGLIVKEYIDRSSQIGPPCAEVLPPDSLPRCPAKTTLPLAHRTEVAEKSKVPLDYFDAGYTGGIKGSDPRNFGPDAWRTLHRFSVGYPEKPVPKTQKACIDFLNGLPYMIPCPHCGYHFLQFVVFNEHWAGQNMTKCRGVCTSVQQACAARMPLVDFLARAHNNVNANNYPCRPMWNATHVVAAYSSLTFTTQGPVDGKCELLKNASEEVGDSPDWVRNGNHRDVLKDRDLCEPGVPREVEDIEHQVIT